MVEKIKTYKRKYITKNNVVKTYNNTIKYSVAPADDEKKVLELHAGGQSISAIIDETKLSRYKIQKIINNDIINIKKCVQTIFHIIYNVFSENSFDR